MQSRDLPLDAYQCVNAIGRGERNLYMLYALDYKVPKNPSYTFHPRQTRRSGRAYRSLTILD